MVDPDRWRPTTIKPNIVLDKTFFISLNQTAKFIN